MSAPAPPGAPRLRTGALLASGLVALCGAGGFLLHHALIPRPGLYAAPVAAAQQVAAASPHPAVPDTATVRTRTIPSRLPKIVLPGLDGVAHGLAEYEGKPLIVNFWATWCEPCRREIPLLQSLRREHAKDGLEIVGIAVDSSDETAKYVSTHAIRYPVLLADRGGLEAVAAFGMDAVLPFSVFADRAGDVVTVKIGELKAAEARLILARMADLDHGTLTLQAAQAQIAAGIAALNAPRPSPDPD